MKKTYFFILALFLLVPLTFAADPYQCVSIGLFEQMFSNSNITGTVQASDFLLYDGTSCCAAASLSNYYTIAETDSRIASNASAILAIAQDNIDKNISAEKARTLNTTTQFIGDMSGPYDATVINGAATAFDGWDKIEADDYNKNNLSNDLASIANITYYGLSLNETINNSIDNRVTSSFLQALLNPVYTSFAYVINSIAGNRTESEAILRDDIDNNYTAAISYTATQDDLVRASIGLNITEHETTFKHGNSTLEIQAVPVVGDEVSGTIGAFVITKNYNDSTEIAAVKSSNATNADLLAGQSPSTYLDNTFNSTADIQQVPVGGDVSGSVGAITITKNYNDSTEIAAVKSSNATNADLLAGQSPDTYLDDTTLSDQDILDLGYNHTTDLTSFYDSRWEELYTAETGRFNLANLTVATSGWDTSQADDWNANNASLFYTAQGPFLLGNLTTYIATLGLFSNINATNMISSYTNITYLKFLDVNYMNQTILNKKYINRTELDNKYANRTEIDTNYYNKTISDSKYFQNSSNGNFGKINATNTTTQTINCNGNCTFIINGQAIRWTYNGSFFGWVS
jgi:hypothetical protein